VQTNEPEDTMSAQHTSPQSTHPAPVVALHCSGAGAGQWRLLGETLGPGYEVHAPEHYGRESAGPWSGQHAFALADEAERTIDLIDRCERKVHLVGHSYGGGLALHVALRRPDRFASLALYEPSAFHLLKQIRGGAGPLAEILAITRVAGDRVNAGDYRSAAAAFMDFWSGKGTWDGLRPEVQRSLTRWAPKAPLDFRALIEEETAADAYAGLDMPTLILRGEHAPRPTFTIAEWLPSVLPDARPAVVAGAGHMGPMTHAAAVSELIAAHIRTVESAMPRPGARRLQPAAATQACSAPLAAAMS
jgi:pimeloyl-ACP methyl ester carboxylesterase